MGRTPVMTKLEATQIQENKKGKIRHKKGNGSLPSSKAWTYAYKFENQRNSKGDLDSEKWKNNRERERTNQRGKIKNKRV